MDRVLNARIKELCGLKKGRDERIDEGVLWCLAHVERMERDMIGKRVYVGEFVGSRSVGRPGKRSLGTLKDFWKKRGLDVRQARKMVLDRNEWWVFLRGNA